MLNFVNRQNMAWELSKREIELKKKLEKAGKMPKHVAAIMDGNGRWAKKRFLPRIAGHKAGIEAVRDIVKVSSKLNIGHLSLYAFSSENWMRPEDEVKGLMKLLIDYLQSEINELHANNVVLSAIGNLDKLPKKVKDLLDESYERTKNNTGLHLNLALSYSGRDDILTAAKKIAQDAKDGKINIDEITAEDLRKNLSTHFAPDVDLLIRTSGEIRISNFLLWEIAYSELYFTEKLWPNFKREDLCVALEEFMGRDRRFGTLENK
jgi:undecaprenyl diphosphate synthase